jgi:hypothetical protein
MDTDRFRVSHTVRASTSADGLVLLDVHAGLVLAANPVGARIWQLLEQQRSCQEIARRLAHDHGIPIDRAHRDVVAFVAALEARGLVTGEPRC